jgi:hypothetical protein
MVDKPKISIKRYLGGLGRGVGCCWWLVQELDRVQCDCNSRR